MPNTPAALRTPAAQNLIAAALAGAAVLARPGRFPRWARRGLSLANTAGTAGSVFLGGNSANPSVKTIAGLTPTRTPSATAASAGSALAAATGGLGLITSGLGIRADAKVESYLTRKGVRHPRIWMAIGVIGVVFVVKQLQDAATAKATDKAKSFVAARQGDPGAPDPAAIADHIPGQIPDPPEPASDSTQPPTA